MPKCNFITISRTPDEILLTVTVKHFSNKKNKKKRNLKTKQLITFNMLSNLLKLFPFLCKKVQSNESFLVLYNL